MLLDKIKEKKFHIILIILFVFILGVIIDFRINVKKYISTSTLLLIRTEQEENKTMRLGNLELSNNLISTFEEVIKSDSTINEIKESLNLNINNDEIRKDIKIEKESDSDTFKIQTINIDENISLNMNKQLIEIFSGKLEEIYSDVELYIVDLPHVSEYKYSISIIFLPIIFILLGIIISIIYITISIIIEKNIKIRLDIEKAINLRKLIEIPLKQKSKTDNELISYESEKTNISIAFKKLRSNIQFINVNNQEKNIILITSPKGKEGKSYITANIAISFAEVGKKVIIIDSDMISGRQSKIFNIPNNLGFSNYLSSLDSNGMEIKLLTNNFINETSIKNLNLITSGTIPPNPSELLASEKLEDLIKDLSVFYDVVIIDGASILTTVDSLILSRFATSTILVTNYKKTKQEDILKAKKDIQNIGGRPIGIIINKTKIRKSKKEFKKIFISIIEKIKKYIISFIKKIKDKIKNSKQKLLTEGIGEKNKNIEKQNQPIEAESSKKQNINPINKFFNIKKESKNKENTNEKEKNDIKNETNETVLKKDDTNIDVKPEGKVNNYINILKNKFKKAKEEYIKNEDEILKEELEKEKSENKSKEKNEDAKNEAINKKEIVLENIKKIKKYYTDFIEDLKPFFDNIQKRFTSMFENLKTKFNNIKEKAIKSNKDNSKNEETNLPQKNFKKENINKENLKEEKNIEVNENSNQYESENNLIYNEENNTAKAEKKEIDNKENDENIVLNQEIKEDTENLDNKSDESVLVVVDGDRAFCRVFSKFCFTEKMINGVDKLDGFDKDQYSGVLMRTRKAKIESMYGLNKKQVKRIDPLVYITLLDYDECVWIERKMISNTAETYINTMAKEYEKREDESKKDYEIRCKRLRKKELEESEIEIEYKIDNLWKNKNLSLTDKVLIRYFAKNYEIKDELKSNIEMKKSIDNKNFYNDVIKKAENELEKISQENEKIMINEELVENEFEKLKEEMEKAEEKKKLEKKKQNIEKRNEKKELSKQKKKDRIKKIEENKRKKEEQKEKAKEEARIEEELLEDNLYPKTKNNKNI